MKSNLQSLAQQVSQVRDTRPRSQRANVVKRIMELRKQGVSLRIIGFAVDLSHETVRKIVNQYEQ